MYDGPTQGTVSREMSGIEVMIGRVNNLTARVDGMNLDIRKVQNLITGMPVDPPLGQGLGLQSPVSVAPGNLESAITELDNVLCRLQDTITNFR